MTYLEDELKLLIKREYLTKKNGKYQTNIPIFTEECNEAIEKRLSGCADETVEGLMTALGAETQKYKETVGNALSDENSLRGQVFTLCSHFGLAETSSYVAAAYGKYPDGGPYRHVNGGGGKGFVWGRSVGNMKHKYNGIYDGLPDKNHRGSVVAFNFAQLANAQQFKSRILEEVVAGVTERRDNIEKRILRLLEDERYFKYGRLVFPVYTGEQFDAFPAVLSNSIEIVADNCRKACEFAAKIVADHAPAHIRGEAEHIGAIVYQHDGLYYLVDALMKKGWLRPVNDTEKPAMFVVTE